jgi:hypothetical protein
MRSAAAFLAKVDLPASDFRLSVPLDEQPPGLPEGASFDMSFGSRR